MVSVRLVLNKDVKRCRLKSQRLAAPAGFADPIEYARDHFKSAINSRDPINETPLKPPNFHKRFAGSFFVHYTNHFRKLFKGSKKHWLLSWIFYKLLRLTSLRNLKMTEHRQNVLRRLSPWAWFVKCFVLSPQTAVGTLSGAIRWMDFVDNFYWSKPIFANCFSKFPNLLKARLTAFPIKCLTWKMKLIV